MANDGITKDRRPPFPASDRASIVYLNAGISHLVRLTVSLWSLRQHWQGAVEILNAGRGDNRLLRQIENDSRLNALVHFIPPAPAGRFGVLAAKASVWRYVEGNPVLLVDADTLFCTSPQPLFDRLAIPTTQFLATQFSNWTTDREPMPGRLRRWMRYHAPNRFDIDRLIADAIGEGIPAINTGVVGWRQSAAMLAEWDELATCGADDRMADELAAQLLLARHRDSTAIVDASWNASPKYLACDPADVKIWHLHGGRHLRPDGMFLWAQAFHAAMEANAGGLRQWAMGPEWNLLGNLAARPA